ncbi:MAG: NAD-dependent epimerase/dehydratase family protein [Planctomycetota bacterium]|jgi:dihydroflavonol-4-reductase
MRVFLTGATGLVGSSVARALIAAGHEVRVLVRETSSLENLTELGVELARGDVTDAESLAAGIAGCDAVVHTAGVMSWSPLQSELMHRVNVEGVTNVLGAAKKTGVRRAVVTASVVAVGGTDRPEVLDETATWDLDRVGVPYLTSKRRGQEAALAMAGDDLEVVCVNPSFVLGPGDIYASSASIVLDTVQGKMPAYVEGGTSCVDVRDVAARHVAALEKGRPGERYILGGENVTMTEFMQRIAVVAGVKSPRRVPYWLASVPAWFGDRKAKRTGKPQPVGRNLLRASALYTMVSSNKAREELGYRPRGLDESLRDTLRYFMQKGRLEPTTPELKALAE